MPDDTHWPPREPAPEPAPEWQWFGARWCVHDGDEVCTLHIVLNTNCQLLVNIARNGTLGGDLDWTETDADVGGASDANNVLALERLRRWIERAAQ